VTEETGEWVVEVRERLTAKMMLDWNFGGRYRGDYRGWNAALHAERADAAGCPNQISSASILIGASSSQLRAPTHAPVTWYLSR
jgi:hypothetical protein